MAGRKTKTTKEEDIVIEEESLSSGDSVIKKLREKLQVCEKDKKEYLDGWQRMKADFVNIQKENEKERQNIVKFAKEGLLNDFLTVVDNFQMAFSNKEAWEKVDENWRQGIEHINTNLMNILESHGLTPIDSLGKEFNPEEHKSVESLAVTDKKEDHLVLEELQKGFKLNGKVIRPAQVKVGIYK